MRCARCQNPIIGHGFQGRLDGQLAIVCCLCQCRPDVVLVGLTETLYRALEEEDAHG